MASNDSDSESDCQQQQSHFLSMNSTITIETDENSCTSSNESDSASTHEHPDPPKKMKSAWSESYSNAATTITTSPPESTQQQQHQQQAMYSDAAMKMMIKMGYDKTKGLGKEGLGRLDPIEPSQQQGRRGLGLKLESVAASGEQYNQNMETIQIPEPIHWLKNSNTNLELENFDMDDLVMWVERAPKKETIDDEIKFCDPEILANVLSSKTVFDNLEPQDVRSARSRSNPFETIRGSIFLNRAAVKMANIDSLCDFMFTKPIDENGKSLVKHDDLLYFADICAGPGGFSEYILYRKGWEAKGFGFTLRGENDFKLHEFFAGSPETFDPYYGVKDDGNIYDPENQESFTQYVLKQTDTGVHFVMADGGFSVKGKENIQEILSKQLYLCQCLTALSILREKGHFVCKLFDLFTPFSIGLVYLMYKCFEEISICKPNTSRPANSERYLICKWKKSNTDTIRRHLSAINQEMFENPNSSDDVYELVRYDELCKDKNFLEYIIESNNRIGQNQIIGLIKIAAYMNNTELKEQTQHECNRKCLQLWQLPEHARKAPTVQTNESLLDELLKEWKTDKTMMSHPPFELKSINDLNKYIKTSIYDWTFVPVCREETEKNIKTFFLCKGRNNVQRYISNGKWESLDYCLDISPKTLVYGEIVTELIGEGRSQNKINALHIIDGIALGGKDIHRLPLRERLKWCDKFARSLNKPYKVYKGQEGQYPVAPIRCKKLYSFQEIQHFFDHMRMYKLKDSNQSRLGFRIRSDDDNKYERFFVPGGLMFFNEINPPYVCCLSKSHNRLYLHNSQTNEAFFINDLTERARLDGYASFRSSFMRRLMWKWTNIHQVELNVDQSNRIDGILFRDDFNEYILKQFSTG